MGLLDDATSMLDAATGGKQSSTAEAEAKYFLKEVLSNPETGESGFVGTSYAGQDDLPNPFDPGIITEFIHFGKVHPDTGKKFPHNIGDTYKPENATVQPEGHAIMFRDALERESIALFGFVSSTKIILKEATENRGAIGAVGDLASNLLGGGSGASKPDPTQLDTFLTDIAAQMATINKPAVLYPEIHEAGVKLHETRATYVAFCQSLNDFYIKPPEGNPLDAAAGALANLPGVGNIMATVQRFAFKMFDLYLAAYLQLRTTHEASVEEAAHDLTIDAIKKDYKDFTYTYPIWFKKPASQIPPEAAGGKNLLKPVTDKINEVKDDIGKKVDKVYDFLGVNGEPDKTPGTAALKAVFAAMKGPTETLPDAKPSASACLITGMDTAMQDIHGIPEFVKKVMTKINDANLGLLEEVYARIMASGADGKIESQYLIEAGRRHLSQKIVLIMADLASGILPGGGDFKMSLTSGKTLSAQQFVAKIIEDKLIHYVDPIIQITIGDLAGQMEASRLKAEENKAQTMEVLLGRLPWLTSLMFKNTFFPIWNLVVEKVFETVSPQVAKVVSAANSVFESAKNAVDTGSDYTNRASAVQKQAAQGLTSVSDVKNLGSSATNESPEAIARREQRERQEQEKNRLDAFYKPNDKDEKFPVVARVADGEGKKVEEEVPNVTTVEEGAAAPPATEQPAADAPTSALPGGMPAGMP